MDPWVPHSELDRVLDARVDAGFVTALWERPGTRVIGVDDRSNVSSDAEGRLLRGIPAGGPYSPQHHYLVGVVGETAWFAVEATPEGPSASLRQLGAVLDETGADVATTAVALVNWHRVAPHCGRCGSRTEVREGGHARWCESCRRQRFPRTDPAVIVAVLDDDDRLLLAHQVVWDATRVSILAGFVEAGESLEQAVHREIAEESGLHLTALAYVGSQPWPFPRSLMVGFVARARGAEVVVDGVEIDQARFFTRAELDVAVDTGAVTLPSNASIASRMIARWRAGLLTV